MAGLQRLHDLLTWPGTNDRVSLSELCELYMTDSMNEAEVTTGRLQSGRADSLGSSESLGESVAARDLDRDLVLRAQSGEVAAFGELIDRYERTVYGIVSRMVASRDEVDDLVQDIFVAAYGSIRGFRGDAKFSTWLHAITVNMTLKRLKQMKKRGAVSIDDPLSGLAETMSDGDGNSPENSLQNREQSVAVRRAVDRLPDKQRIVVVMHYFEQHSCEEIAAILKCSVGTVWSRLHYACRKLKTDLDWVPGR